VSLILIATITAAVAASAGYLAARRRTQAAQGERADPPEKREPAPDPLAALPLRVGDVVQSGREERWLAGAIVARERGEVIAAVFLAPEGAAQGAIAAFAAPREDIFWMAPSEVESPNEPPAALEIGGIPMQRRGRVPVALERLGQGAPRLGEEGMLATYDAGEGSVAVVLRSEGCTYAWSGRRLEAGEYDRLGHGGEEG
jgi:hypothetical protein